MSFFDEVETTVANTRFLQAVEDHGPVTLELTPYDQLGEFERSYRKNLGMRRVLKEKTVRYYQYKRFLRENQDYGWLGLLEELDKFSTCKLADRMAIAVDTFVKYLDPTKLDAALDAPPVGQEKTTEKKDESSNEDRKEESLLNESNDIARKEQEKRSMDDLLHALSKNQQAREVIEHIRIRIERGDKPPDWLFKPLRGVLADLLEPRMGNFLESDHYKRMIQLEQYTKRATKLEDFRIFRVLGRGAFGAVSAVQRIDTHAIYAMKEMNKKQVKQNHSEWMVIIEKKVLQKMNSPFVLNLKYSFHNAESLFLIFDMCTGGDLKYHLRQAIKDGKSFGAKQAQFCAAEVFLGLEHIHSFDIVYRDLKPNNILLDQSGHLKISDLGLAIKLRPDKVLKHLAGTAGYWAPEIVMKTGTYKVSDYWSFGTFLYEMISGKRPGCKCQKNTLEWCPFGQTPAMEQNALHDEGILKIDVDYPPARFSAPARDLLEKLFVTDPKKRLGAAGPHEVKEHPYFKEIDWERLQNQEIEPPFVPDARTVHASSIGEVGEFSKRKFRRVKLTEEDSKHYEDFTYTSEEGIQQELLDAVMKMDNPPPKPQHEMARPMENSNCCSLA